MNIPGLTVAKTAVGAVTERSLVVYGANDGEVAIATDGAALIIGVSTDVPAIDAGRCDVIRSGLAPVYYGETIAVGDPLTADATGRAIKATTTGSYIIGYAETSGDENDLGSVWIVPAVKA